MYTSCVGALCAGLRTWRTHAPSFSGSTWFYFYSSTCHKGAVTDGGENSDFWKQSQFRGTSVSQRDCSVDSITFNLANDSGHFHMLQHLSCGWWLKICQLMPFCTVAACFQECEPRALLSKRKKDIRSFLNKTSGYPVMQTPIPPPPHISPQVLKSVHGRLSTGTSELNSGVLSPRLYYDVSIVPVCLFVFSIHLSLVSFFMRMIFYHECPPEQMEATGVQYGVWF